MTRQQQAELQKHWDTDPRWKGIKRGYSADDVVRLRGSCRRAHAGEARRGKALGLINEEPFVNALGALTGNQAMQQVKAGLKAIYLSGWQVAGDANWPARCTPTSRCIRPTRCRGRQAHQQHAARADQIQWRRQGRRLRLRADRGRCGSRLRRRAERVRTDEGDDRGRRAGVHFEDQLASVKKCGHMGGKVLVPTREAVAKLTPRAWPPT
jgi:isocitrate lyase